MSEFDVLQLVSEVEADPELQGVWCFTPIHGNEKNAWLWVRTPDDEDTRFAEVPTKIARLICELHNEARINADLNKVKVTIEVMPKNKCFYDLGVITDTFDALIHANRDKYGIHEIKVERLTITIVLRKRLNEPFDENELELARKSYADVAERASEESYRRRYPKNSDPGLGVVPEEIRRA